MAASDRSPASAAPPGRRRVVVGIPVRNEEGTIVEAVKHVVAAAEVLRRSYPEVDVSCIVCFNGCQDASEVVLQRELARRPPAIDVQSTVSAPGIIPAMARIAEAAAPADLLFFCDADIVVAEHSLASIYRALSDDDRVMLAYAPARVMLPGAPTRLQRLLCAAFSDPLLYPPRLFFRGSCYGVRPELFRNGCIELWHDPVDAPSVRVRGRRRTPLADDVSMSCCIVERYGLDAIARVPEARILVTPPLNIADVFLGHRRKHFEYRTLNAIWPERSALLRKLGRAPVQWRYVLRQRPAHAAFLLCHVALRSAIDLIARLDAGLAWWDLPHVPAELFGARRTTKHLHATGQQPIVTLEPRL